MSKIRDLIFFISLFASYIYFSVEAVFGENLIGADDSPPSYKYYCIICFISFFIVFYYQVKVLKVNRRMLFSFFVISIYILSSFINGYWNMKSGLCLIAFCLPASCMGIYYSRTHLYGHLMKYFDLLIPFMSMSLVFMLSNLVMVAAEGIKQYSQIISNLAAMCYLFDIFILAFGHKYERFHFATTKWYRYFCFLLIPLYVFVIFFSGGRGGAVIVFVGTLILLIITKQSLKKIMGLTIVISLCVYFIISQLDDSLIAMLEVNADRLFSYISSEGLDMSQTSNRDSVFETAMVFISDSPLWGYGLFGYYDVLGYYPHNLFLEILLQGGAIFLVFSLWALWIMFIKLCKMQKNNNSLYLLLPFIIYPFVQLLFTGSYMETPFFWFSVMFVVNYDVSSKNTMIESSVRLNNSF